MGKQNGRRNRYSQIQEQFAPRTVSMLESPAYRALSLSAHRVLARIEVEMAHHGGRDNGRLPVTYDDFQRYGIDRHSIHPAILELVALGFVEVTEPGRAGNAEWRRPAKYRLTYRHTEDGPPTNDWKRFSSHKESVAAAKNARKKN